MPISPHARQERERIADEREESSDRYARFAPRGRDWWQAREEDGLPTLAEEMASLEPDGSDDDSDDEDDDWDDDDGDEDDDSDGDLDLDDDDD